jgi:hypothetical protein
MQTELRQGVDGKWYEVLKANTSANATRKEKEGK